VTLVAQSMGAFTAALVCARAPKSIRELVLVNAMVPLPGETAGEWWEHTGWEEARAAAARRGGYPVEFDLDTYFLHDVPKRIAKRLASHERDEAEIAFREPAAFERWPDLPIHVVAGKDDRFFSASFQARLARERLDRAAHEIPGGHLVALSRPRELAELLLSYVSEVTARERTSGERDPCRRSSPLSTRRARCVRTIGRGGRSLWRISSRRISASASSHRNVGCRSATCATGSTGCARSRARW
jgi:hypothetical protein